MTGSNRRLSLNRFARDESGALIVFALLMFVAMLMVGGIGIDVMHLERERSKAQYTLDAAVLAAADLEQTLDPVDVANDYFAKAGMKETIETISVDESALHRQIDAEVVTRMNTQFMHMNDVTELGALSRSVAREAVPDTEISLLLDISGSMKHNNRVDVMKPAAKTFVTKVLSRNIDGYGRKTTVNVIPYAGQTNPGPEMFEYLGGVRMGTTGSDWFPEWPQDISNVVFWFDTDGDMVEDYSVKFEGYPGNEVELFNKDDLDTYIHYALDFIERHSPVATEANSMVLGASIKGGRQTTAFYDVTGTGIVGSTKFNQTDESYNFSEFYNAIVPNNISSCIELDYDDFMDTALPDAGQAQVGHFAKWTYDGTQQDWGWCPEDDTAIQYAQDDEQKLHGFIDSLRLHDGTGTNYGLKWALALLDPAAQPAFEALAAQGVVPAANANRPLAWEAEESAKVIVLMTDGEITGQDRPSDDLDPLNKIEELSDRPSDESISTSSRWTNLQLFYQQCDLAKQKGAVIYTVAFEAPNAAKEEMRACASSPAHFFEVDGEGLIDAFVAIASSIQRLRLIQ